MVPAPAEYVKSRPPGKSSEFQMSEQSPYYIGGVIAWLPTDCALP